MDIVHLKPRDMSTISRLQFRSTRPQPQRDIASHCQHRRWPASRPTLLWPKPPIPTSTWNKATFDSLSAVRGAKRHTTCRHTTIGTRLIGARLIDTRIIDTRLCRTSPAAAIMEGPKSLRTIDCPGVKAEGDLLRTLRREVAELLGRGGNMSFPGAQPVSFASRHLEELKRQE